MIIWCILAFRCILRIDLRNDSIHTPHKVEVVGAEESKGKIEIKQNDIVEQKIEIQTNEIDGISLRLGNTGNEEAHAHVELYDEMEQLLKSWEWNSKEGSQGEYYNFLLDKSIAGVKGKNIRFLIRADLVGKSGLFIPAVEYKK